MAELNDHRRSKLRDLEESSIFKKINTHYRVAHYPIRGIQRTVDIWFEYNSRYVHIVRLREYLFWELDICGEEVSTNLNSSIIN